MKNLRILGIDPGTNVLGYAVIEVCGPEVTILNMGVVTQSKHDAHTDKLKRIFDRTCEVINAYHPTQLAIEAPFYGKNVQSMLKLGRAQGVAMAAGLSKSLDVIEYSPKRIKQAVTGNGNATKEQVATMLETILKCRLDDQLLDATDALATAICHHFQSNSQLGNLNKKGGWKNFLSDNPDRLWQP